DVGLFLIADAGVVPDAVAHRRRDETDLPAFEMRSEPAQHRGRPGDVCIAEGVEGFVRIGELARGPFGEAVDDADLAVATAESDETHPRVGFGEGLHDGFAAIRRSVRADEDSQFPVWIVRGED